MRQPMCSKRNGQRCGSTPTPPTSFVMYVCTIHIALYIYIYIHIYTHSIRICIFIRMHVLWATARNSKKSCACAFFVWRDLFTNLNKLCTQNDLNYHERRRRSNIVRTQKKKTKKTRLRNHSSICTGKINIIAKWLAAALSESDLNFRKLQLQYIMQ